MDTVKGVVTSDKVLSGHPSLPSLQLRTEDEEFTPVPDFTG